MLARRSSQRLHPAAAGDTANGAAVAAAEDDGSDSDLQMLDMQTADDLATADNAGKRKRHEAGSEGGGSPMSAAKKARTATPPVSWNDDTAAAVEVADGIGAPLAAPDDIDLCILNDD